MLFFAKDWLPVWGSTAGACPMQLVGRLDAGTGRAQLEEYIKIAGVLVPQICLSLHVSFAQEWARPHELGVRFADRSKLPRILDYSRKRRAIHRKERRGLRRHGQPLALDRWSKLSRIRVDLDTRAFDLKVAPVRKYPRQLLGLRLV